MSHSAADISTAPGRLDPGYLESLFQGAGFGILACRPDGCIVAGNLAARRLFGVGRRALGGPVSAQFPEADRPSVESALASVRTTLAATEFQARLGGTADDPVEYAVWVMPVLEADGALQGISLWFRDITQRMRLQRTLDKTGRLESLITLSGAVAHHYNNILCSIATSLEYAINMTTVTAMRGALKRTADAVSQAGHMTRQLLAFAQADYQATDLADLTEIVLYFLDQIEERLSKQHIKLLVDWQIVPLIAVRRDQLVIVLNNLIDNAVEAMPGGGTLSVTLSRRDEDTMCLSINDTGPGIDAAHMEHLFEPFFTTKGTLGQGNGRNPGMGLAVAHGLVAEMGGTIRASNVPGSGARFDIIFPIRPAAKKACK
jgi:signal transduction histidine kinase